MLHSIRLAAVALIAIALFGCAKQQARDTGEYAYGASEEWRLRTLEENALEQRNAQLELANQVTQLQRKVQEMEQRGTAAPSGPVPLLSSKDLPEPGPVKPMAAPKTAPMEEKGESGMKDEGSKWDAYPDASQKAADKPMAEKPAMKKAPAKPMKTASAKMAAAPAGKAAYDKALKLVLDGKSAKGRTGMESFLTKYPKSSLVPNARYWLGESYYHEKRYAESVVAFRKVHQMHPRHEKAAAALLKIGYAYAALGDKKNARFYLDVLVEDYPKSEPASMARKRLKTLK